MSKKLKFHKTLTRIVGTLHEEQCTFLIISRSALFRTRNAADKRCPEKSQHILFSVAFFSENPAVYEIMWKNIVEPDRPQMKTWCMRNACWIPKATKSTQNT